MYKCIYREVTETKVGQRDRGSWLKRSTLWPMVSGFVELSVAYDLSWCESWGDHLDDMAWLRRAMSNTYIKLKEADKEKVRFEYELFLEHDKYCDWQAMADPCFDALCFILDRLGRRVESEGVLVTVIRELRGETKRTAREKLDTDCYEFIEWM